MYKLIHQLEIMNQNLNAIVKNQAVIYCELKSIKLQLKENQQKSIDRKS
nr:hypothetical protein [uncultured Caproiciproducens sp.]